jgi:hypothetical protein
MVLDVNTIATDADLASEFGGITKLNATKSDIGLRDKFRAEALSDALNALRMRSPAIYDYQLTTPSELKMAVVYRALSKICFTSIAQEGDRHHVLAKNYQNEYFGALRGDFSVAPVGSTNASSGGGSFAIGRR